MAIQHFLWFHTIIIFWSISLKKAIGILMRTALNLYIGLGNIPTLIVLILPIHEHQISLYFFVSSLVSFNMSYSFQYIGLSHHLLSSFPGILFVAIAKGIVFLISFSEISLLECNVLLHIDFVS